MRDKDKTKMQLIDELKKLRKQLDEYIWTEETRQVIMDASPDLIAVIDRKGTILDINKTMAKRFGKKPEELISANGWTLLPKVLAETRSNNFRRVFRTGKSYRFEDENRGTHFDNIVYPVRKEHGEVTRVAVHARDVTAKKKAQEREKKLQTELNRSSRLASIGYLVAGMAHEINNPLTGILGFSERLLKRSSDTNIIKDMERIHNEALRATRVIDNLHAFTDYIEPEMKRIDVNEILKKTLELRSYELKTSNIELIINMAEDLPNILADFEQIREVFQNLILNAEQAVTESERKGKITLSTSRLKNRIRISFDDNGPGIPFEYQDRVFDPFFTMRKDKGGSGLGLSISYSIINKHGGSIYMKSSPGNGSTFIVELPVAREIAEKDKKKNLV